MLCIQLWYIEKPASVLQPCCANFLWASSRSQYLDTDSFGRCFYLYRIHSVGWSTLLECTLGSHLSECNCWSDGCVLSLSSTFAMCADTQKRALCVCVLHKPGRYCVCFTVQRFLPGCSALQHRHVNTQSCWHSQTTRIIPTSSAERHAPLFFVLFSGFFVSK